MQEEKHFLNSKLITMYHNINLDQYASDPIKAIELLYVLAQYNKFLEEQWRTKNGTEISQETREKGLKMFVESSIFQNKLK